MAQKQYGVYANRPNNKAVGHILGCPHSKIHGGHTTAAGGHMEPFDSPENAELAGWMIGLPFHWCQHCCPTTH
jgi:hypothetical protein